jgi:hypothetical protein
MSENQTFRVRVQVVFRGFIDVNAANATEAVNRVNGMSAGALIDSNGMLTMEKRPTIIAIPDPVSPESAYD